MKTIAALSVVAITAAVAFFQSSDDERDGRPDGQRPRDPYMVLFDTDEDDEISSTEIKNATAVLTKLDANSDGILTRRELPRPPRRGDRDGDENHGRRDDRPEGDRPMRSGNRPENNRSNQSRPQRPDMDIEPTAVDLRSAKPGDVVLSGGHTTDRRDGGRPVVLIAAALGVEPQVFRDAFSNVNPSRSGAASRALQTANKKVLLDALGKHGITNDRLDTVSDYYRYKPQDGGLWKTTPATAKAIIKNGKVTDIKIVNPGSGYMTAPNVTIAGHSDIRVLATIGFSKDFSKNGSITSLKIQN